MSGPIVRTGTTPEFWKNWDQVFGDKKKVTKKVTKKGKKKVKKKVTKKASAKAKKKK